MPIWRAAKSRSRSSRERRCFITVFTRYEEALLSPIRCTSSKRHDIASSRLCVGRRGFPDFSGYELARFALLRCALRSRGLPPPVLSNTLQLFVACPHVKIMFLALPFPAFAEAAFACATATQLVGVSSIPAFPAFSRMLRPARAPCCKQELVCARAVGVEPRHTRTGCPHPLSLIHI